MITIATAHLETQIVLSDENPIILIEENPVEYRRVVFELQQAMNGELSDFSFWIKHEEIIPSKIGEMVCELFSFDFCDKKIITLLQKQLQSHFINGDFLPTFQDISSNIENFLQDIGQTVDFAVEYDGISSEGLFKLCNIRPAKAYDSFLEKLICYINLFISLKKTDFFIFVGLKLMMTDEEMQQLYHHCRLRKVKLLLVEPAKLRPTLPEEKAIIITEDLCEILENFSEM